MSAEDEVWLRGGLIVDGSGGPPVEGDVGIRAERIIDVVPGGIPHGTAGRDVDCRGMVVTPGFIDIHTHSDASFLLNHTAPSKVMQGVTTEVVGNCGFSAFPVDPDRRALLEEFLKGLGIPRLETAWVDFEGYAQAVAGARPVMNTAALVGHGALRIAAMGMGDTDSTAEARDRMAILLRTALEQGAFGLSTGLTYVPSSFATPDELHALGRVVADSGALYATHARVTEGFDAFEEAFEFGRRTGARVQFSHVSLNDPRSWGKAGDVLERFEKVECEGVDIRFDVYPYDASASSLTQYLPAWLQADGEEAIAAHLNDAELHERARAELSAGLFGSIPWDWSRVLLSLTGPGDEDMEGRTVKEAADRESVTPEDLCLRLCARHGNRAQVVLFYRSEDDVRAFLRHRMAILGSDGSALPEFAPGRPHPRNFGAHARLLQRYVVDDQLLSLPEAVHKSTLAAAERLDVPDRGRLARGTMADVVVLDLPNVREVGTWTDPCRQARGVRDVWINGTAVVSAGALTGACPGQVLRR
ncbi:N-acyl-D-amino-acid deacylase family protein [Amycolatopsis thermoflava]|uniref:N-acyl-D-amino-acid deacylase family protein n=1 Tax=Amycolatopsis thermoflava TaxID=84480 RepID=UPI003EBC9B51